MVNLKITAKECFLAEMLERSIGNTDFNKNLSTLKKDKGHFLNTKYEDEIDELRYFAFKTRSAGQINKITKKCSANLDLMEAKRNIKDSEKISLKEYGILTDIAKMQVYLEDYDTKGLLPKEGKLADLYKQSNQG